MPVTTTYPGVYIEEIPSGVRTIVGVSTSVAAFIGYFTRGPLNKAIQIFNMGDFQRNFGGLNSLSEAGYAIQQFFLNGGTECWVIRTAAGPPIAASIGMEDGAGTDVLAATAGRRMRGVSIADPGEWGNNLRIEIDYDTTDPATLFNLTVSEITTRDGRQAIVQSETYRNLTMDEAASNYAVEVVNEASRLVQLTKLTPLGDTTRPAATGTMGGDASGAEALVADGNTFNVDIVDSSNVTIASPLVTLSIPIPPTNLLDVRTILQRSLRAAGDTAGEPLLSGASVQLVGTQFRVLGGRNGVGFDSEIRLDFVGGSATPLGLVGAAVNVQQYVLGSANNVAAQGAGTAGDDGSLPDSAELIGIPDPAKTGMFALEDVDLFNILCIPRAADLADQGFAVYSAAETYCEARRAFLLVDLPADVDAVQDARDWLEENATLRHRNAAAYFPRPRIPDPLNGFRLRNVAASGTIAGLFARTDATRGVWKAPAGTEGTLRGVPDLAYKLTDPENGQLNPLGLNCLRTFDVHGNVAWGARTLEGADQRASEWKYVPVRRIALFIEESLYRGTQWVVFEPNDEPLWSQIRLNVGAFMQNLFVQGAFQGTTPREAYFVKCDHETTTQNDIDAGVVNILVGFAPLKPAEFVIIKIQQLAGQIQT
jgi:hypothetical protein